MQQNMLPCYKLNVKFQGYFFFNRIFVEFLEFDLTYVKICQNTLFMNHEQKILELETERIATLLSN